MDRERTSRNVRPAAGFCCRIVLVSLVTPSSIAAISLLMIISLLLAPSHQDVRDSCPAGRAIMRAVSRDFRSDRRINEIYFSPKVCLPKRSWACLMLKILSLSNPCPFTDKLIVHVVSSVMIECRSCHTSFMGPGSVPTRTVKFKSFDYFGHH